MSDSSGNTSGMAWNSGMSGINGVSDNNVCYVWNNGMYLYCSVTSKCAEQGPTLRLTRLNNPPPPLKKQKALKSSGL